MPERPQTAEEIDARLMEVENELLQLEPANPNIPEADVIVAEQVYEDEGRLPK